MKEDVIARMVGKWDGALRLAGLEEFLTGVHGPCPLCGGTDRFRYDDKEGRGRYFCNGCGAGDGMKLLMGVRNEGFAEVANWLRSEYLRDLGESKTPKSFEPRIQPAAKPGQDVEAKRERLRKLWAEGVAVRVGDPVWLYLTQTRGYPLTLEQLPPKRVRFHRSLPYYEKVVEGGKARQRYVGSFSAMLWLVQKLDGSGAAIHRTYLTPDGKKAPVVEVKKLSVSLGVKGGAIRLMAPARRMGVAEGIESAYGAWMLTGIPTWACVATEFLAAFNPPEFVEELIVFADNDPPDEKGRLPGLAAALTLRDRCEEELGTPTRIRLSDREGEDFDDYWHRIRKAEAA